MKRFCFLIGIGAISASPAFACEYDPFLFQLPGETVSQAEQRSTSVRSSYRTVEHFERETHAWEKATSVYLARVVSAAPLTFVPGKRTVPSTAVEPIHALRGVIPKGQQRITDEAEGGMCSDVGDGEAAWAKPGELVMVFAGLPTDTYRPRGIDSFKASDIRTAAILGELRAYGKDLED